LRPASAFLINPLHLAPMLRRLYRLGIVGLLRPSRQHFCKRSQNLEFGRHAASSRIRVCGFQHLAQFRDNVFDGEGFQLLVLRQFPFLTLDGV
jgi:hypothetical protein